MFVILFISRLNFPTTEFVKIRETYIFVRFKAACMFSYSPVNGYGSPTVLYLHNFQAFLSAVLLLPNTDRLQQV